MPHETAELRTVLASQQSQEHRTIFLNTSRTLFAVQGLCSGTMSDSRALLAEAMLKTVVLDTELTIDDLASE